MGMTAAYSQFHVLAVDDNLIDRKLIERLLKISSFQVTTVDSGSKALEFLGLHEDEKSSSNEIPVSPKNNQDQVVVNLVITDYCMPGMTGYDLLKKIKESSSLKNIPVVILSSENVPSRITRCLEEGAEDFFLKPMKLSDVNKLRPHVMRAKCTNNNNSIQKPENKEKQESINQGKTTAFEETQLQAAQSVQPQQLQQTPHTNGGNNNNSKRNPLRMGFEQTGQGPELYNGLTVMSN